MNRKQELLLSVIVPCRNEERFIEKALESILGQENTKCNIEVLVADGLSSDGTRDILQILAARDSRIKLIDNPRGIVPTGLNAAIREAKGEIILRMDAHTIYEKNYIAKCVKYLAEHNVDNVGGVCLTLPGKTSLIGQSIALSLSHSFGVGNAYFRIGVREPKYVDTVPFGCYRKEVFEKIGFFDEDLVRNQDDEFNLRLKKNGGKILLVPDIISYYYARDSLSKLFKMYYQYGYFKPLVAQKVGGVFTWRQLIPALFVGSLIATSALSLVAKPFLWLLFLILSLYLFANLAISFCIAERKGLKYILALPVVFATLHFSYGIGYLKGIWDFFILNKNKRKRIKDLPLSR